MHLLLTALIALAAFAAGLLVGLKRRPAADGAIAAENADLRRRMDELADALMARATHGDPAGSTPPDERAEDGTGTRA